MNEWQRSDNACEVTLTFPLSKVGMFCIQCYWKAFLNSDLLLENPVNDFEEIMLPIRPAEGEVN